MDETPHLGEQMPQTIGRYQVQESIGYGAMGAVYKAFDPLIKRTLAIKTIRLDIPKQSPQYKSFIERFYHEARISGTLSHPNIVTLFDIGEEGGLPYLAMEYVEGETIASILERGLRFKPEKVIGLVSQVASAVDYAHTKGVIHRDIKPSNLILFDVDRVKVTDFGIAKLVNAEMTQSGTLLGTPSYMSPEQAMGDKLDGRSDIFSLGVCAFEMLCGEQPFPGNNVTSILYKLVHVDPIEPANLEMNGLVPEKWHEVFGRVLAKKPDDRYQTATEFVQDLEYCLGAWFGAMGEDTLGAAAAGTSAPAGEGATDESTARLPAVSPSAAPTRKTHPPGVRQTSGPGGRTSGLGPRKTSPPGTPSTSRSDVYAAPPGLKPPPAARKTGPMPPVPGRSAAAAAGAAPPEGPTVLMKAPPPARRPGAPTPPPVPEGEAATVLMRGPGRSGPPSSRPAQPAHSAEAEDPSTVIMTSPSRRGAGPEAAPRGGGQRAAAPALDRTPTPVPPGAERTPTPVTPLPGPVTVTAPVLVEPRRFSLTLVLVGVGLLLFLVVMTAAAVLVMKKREAATVASPPSVTVPVPVRPARVRPTAAPSSVTSGIVHVDSSPSGAAAYVDGHNRGTTPLDVHDLPLADHEVKLELDGYTPVTQTVTLTAAAPSSAVNVSLTRVPPSVGAADVLSTPAGAAVRIDGASVGQTPLVGQRLKSGAHRVEVAHEGFEPWSRSVTVGAGKTAHVDAQLVPVAARTPVPARTSSGPAAPPTPDPHVYAETDVDTRPVKVSGKSPDYPSGVPQLKSGQRASVTLTFVVLETGEVTDVQVVESAGSALDDAVTAAYKTWKFTPGIRQGAKVKVKVTRRHTFLGG